METVEDFNYVFQPSLRRDVPVRLATATFIPEAENAIFHGVPGMGKSHLGIAPGCKGLPARVSGTL